MYRPHLTAMGGDRADGCSFATAAALRHFRRPTVDVNNDNNGVGGHTRVWKSDERGPSTPPLRNTPLRVTYALIARDDNVASSGLVCALSNPTDREDLVLDSTITFS